MPLISIVVPVYNVERYLHRCLDSILNQTFRDFELILVDDGSPDNCPAICDEYAEIDNRVRVIHQENGGVSAARNAGMGIAQGKFLLFCDSDDFVAPEWCESLLAATTASQDNYIFGRIIKDFEGEDKSQSPITDEKIDIGDGSVGAFLRLHTQSRTGFAWNVLYYANTIKELGLRFQSDIIIEDLPFCLEYLKKMRSLSYCDKACYFYLQRQESTLSKKYYQDGFRKWREKYAVIQDFIRNKIPANEQEVYQGLIAEYYLYFFLSSLDNTFDQRNKLSILEKLQYNQQVIKTEEFRHCLIHCEGKNENQRYLKLLKNGNYGIVYLYVCAAKIKTKIKKSLE